MEATAPLSGQHPHDARDSGLQRQPSVRQAALEQLPTPIKSRRAASMAPTKYELVINLKTARRSALKFRRRCSPSPTR
jgi:hypothetical protein